MNADGASHMPARRSEPVGQPLVPAVESLTPAQSRRRSRILAVAGELASEGGWDAVQMREVAGGADVALGTLYRYFPSKEYLLVSMMIAEVQALAEQLAVKPPQGSDPVERVIDVLRRANAALQRRPLATIATIRALVSGNTDIAPAVNETFEIMRRIVTDALSDGALSDGALSDSESAVVDDRDFSLTIELLTDIWMASLVEWISGFATEESILPKLEEATRVLFDRV